MDLDRNKYIRMFVDETEEHLSSINDLLLKLEDDPSDEKCLNEILRCAHSVKGMAASMGFSGISDLTHVMEDLFSKLSGSVESVNGSFTELTFEALDFLSTAVREISENGIMSSSPDELISSFRTALNSGDHNNCSSDKEKASHNEDEDIYEVEVIENEAPETENTSGSELTVTIRILPESALPAARAMVALNGLKSYFSSIISVEPDQKSISAGSFDNQLTIRGITEKNAEDFSAKISSFSDIADFSVQFASPSSPENDPEADHEHSQGSIRIGTSHLDSLFNEVGELIVQHSRLKTALDKKDDLSLTNGLNRLKTTIDHMYNEVLSVRMMPFSYISPRFRRTVRDATRKTGKSVDFSITGDDIQLDRSILDELVDPVNHMLRNSIDHGIELPDKRKETGKNGTGSISINISRSGDVIRIKISDDGKGIDSDRIKDIALKKGYITAKEHAGISREEALMLCTIPGFSTREAVSDLSGRGVGMDVVRTKIESIGGHMHFTSVLGKGTEIALEVPLTVVVINAFLTKELDSFYAFPVSKVKRTMEIEGGKIITKQGRAYIQAGDDDIKIHRLSNLLGTGNKNEACEERLPSLVVEKSGKSHAITVEEILGTTEIVVKPLGDPLEHLRQYSGATILGDGSIALIVDTENMI